MPWLKAPLLFWTLEWHSNLQRAFALEVQDICVISLEFILAKTLDSYLQR